MPTIAVANSKDEAGVIRIFGKIPNMPESFIVSAETTQHHDKIRSFRANVAISARCCADFQENPQDGLQTSMLPRKIPNMGRILRKYCGKFIA
jgi:hypothetical protein